MILGKSINDGHVDCKLGRSARTSRTVARRASDIVNQFYNAQWALRSSDLLMLRELEDFCFLYQIYLLIVLQRTNQSPFMPKSLKPAVGGSDQQAYIQLWATFKAWAYARPS